FLLQLAGHPDGRFQIGDANDLCRAMVDFRPIGAVIKRPHDEIRKFHITISPFSVFLTGFYHLSAVKSTTDSPFRPARTGWTGRRRDDTMGPATEPINQRGR